MEIYKSKEDLKRKTPFPKYNSKNGVGAFFAYLLSILVWIGVLIIGLVLLYTHWFRKNLIYLFQLVSPKAYYLPFWLALLLVLLPVTFPLTLVVIIVATLIKVIKA